MASCRCLAAAIACYLQLGARAVYSFFFFPHSLRSLQFYRGEARLGQIITHGEKKPFLILVPLQASGPVHLAQELENAVKIGMRLLGNGRSPTAAAAEPICISLANTM
jgi:hypothetical protein